MTKDIVLFVALLFFVFAGHAEQEDFPVLKGPYLGQKPPEMTPEVFAPGIVSGPHDERIIYFTPGGKELFYQLRGAPHTIVVQMKQQDDRWLPAETAFFSGKYFCEFSLTADGNRIVYCSNQPLSGRGPPEKRWRTWMIERNGSVWGQPKVYDIATGYPVMSLNNNLYFFKYLEDGGHDGQIFMTAFGGKGFSIPVDIGNADNQIKTTVHEVDPFIAPDESYLIFCSNRDGGFGDADLYVCFKKPDGSWTRARNMGASINTEATEFCPSVTPDGKYLFFASNRGQHRNYSEGRLSYEEKLRVLNSFSNGSNDIYWVDAKVIEKLRSKDFK